MLKQFPGKPVRVFVVWEPVLPTDWGSPSTASLNRILDARASQYWDQDRLVSKSLGEHDSDSIVWDHVAVYGPGVSWSPASASFAKGPVVSVLDPLREAIAKALSPSNPAK